jgi:hypothetical protein
MTNLTAYNKIALIDIILLVLASLIVVLIIGRAPGF